MFTAMRYFHLKFVVSAGRVHAQPRSWSIDHSLAVGHGPVSYVVSNCCYVVTMVSTARDLRREWPVAVRKVRDATGALPAELWISTALQGLVRSWLGTKRLCTLEIQVSDRLENEVQLRGAPGLLGIPGRYAALFFARELYEGLSIDIQADTRKVPIVPRGTHGQDQSQDRQR